MAKIIGAHSIIYSTHPEADRALLRDVFGLPNVDAGDGWLIFGLPPAELAVHPADENDRHEFYLMCDNVAALVVELRQRDIPCAPVQNQGWGLLTRVTLPGGGTLGIYEPRHARPGATEQAEPTVVMQPIGTVRSPYTDAARIPKGRGAEHQAEGILEVLPRFEAGLTDIEGFSHLYVLWVFDRTAGYDLLATPPTDTRPHGVFATRAPRRPNPIGLTVVTLLRRDGPRLHVRGVDMLDGTPILDIKPYLSSIPADELRRGWLAEAGA